MYRLIENRNSFHQHDLFKGMDKQGDKKSKLGEQQEKFLEIMRSLIIDELEKKGEIFDDPRSNNPNRRGGTKIPKHKKSN
jgi:hypothetical protein